MVSSVQGEAAVINYLAGDSALAVRFLWSHGRIWRPPIFKACRPDYKLSLSRDRHSVSTVPEVLTQ